jgi:hypothetical protein
LAISNNRSDTLIKAQSAPSVIYDYYNPSARVTLAPTRFVVQ